MYLMTSTLLTSSCGWPSSVFPASNNCCRSLTVRSMLICMSSYSLIPSGRVSFMCSTDAERMVKGVSISWEMSRNALFVCTCFLTFLPCRYSHLPKEIMRINSRIVPASSHPFKFINHFSMAAKVRILFQITIFSVEKMKKGGENSSIFVNYGLNFVKIT